MLGDIPAWQLATRLHPSHVCASLGDRCAYLGALMFGPHRDTRVKVKRDIPRWGTTDGCLASPLRPNTPTH